ncbi:hypothetical protein AR158_c653R [Paramecium bursaria Chlorella virus AR158]|uniref:hypothetical protein n=1 Tax=Paramecium bursaria Chlorella virus AR158 TaxID=380598 RepID=UPI00015AA808|nr:hypothetical protein AR158_c653R [Paramecium bursaria Chlorella virus AR158]ABU44198.1 hypothetical protein AR158_c653R [Paramecium bursaria Chlorella virus AR158]
MLVKFAFRPTTTVPEVGFVPVLSILIFAPKTHVESVNVARFIPVPTMVDFDTSAPDAPSTPTLFNDPMTNVLSTVPVFPIILLYPNIYVSVMDC